MASASGGGSHPSHLPITTLSSHGQRTVGGSLQTPDASSLFVSSLGGTGGGGSGNNFAPSPLEHSQSFTSLEELLNVTGINSFELDPYSGAKKRDGVDSLQQIAKEVESNQG